MFRIILTLLLTTAACTNVEKKPETFVSIGGDATLKLPPPQEILPGIELTQLLTFEYQNSKKSIQTVLTSNDSKLTLVGLLPLGGEAFRVEYQGGAIISQKPVGMDQSFDLKMALADIILVYSESKTLSGWLSNGARVVDQKNQRSILLNEKPIIKIHYSDPAKLKAKINYEHLLRGYKIQIQTLSQGTSGKKL